MDNSEEQFQELIANLIPHVNQALTKQDTVPPMGLLLLVDGQVEVTLAVSDGEMSASDEVAMVQQSLIENAKEKSATAACLSYADYSNGVVVVYLENNENYCVKCSIPVVNNPSLQLDPERMEIEDGIIFVFGEGDPS